MADSTERTGQLERQVAALGDRLDYLLIKDEIVNRLNNYGYTLDLNQFEAYEANFTDDCHAVMSFSSHNGRTGLGKWMKSALAGVDRGVHLSSNFEIKLDKTSSFKDCREAKIRTKLHAACHFEGGDLSKCLTLGGIYDWTMTRQDGDSEWLISYVRFEPFWSKGDATLLEASS